MNTAQEISSRVNIHWRAFDAPHGEAYGAASTASWASWNGAVQYAGRLISGLLGFGRIDAVQTDALACDNDGVAIDDAGLAGQICGGRAQRDECGHRDGGEEC